MPNIFGGGLLTQDEYLFKYKFPGLGLQDQIWGDRQIHMPEKNWRRKPPYPKEK